MVKCKYFYRNRVLLSNHTTVKLERYNHYICFQLLWLVPKLCFITCFIGSLLCHLEFD